MARLRRVANQREMEYVLDDFLAQGYDLLTQTNTSARFRKNTWGSVPGHVLWFLLTFWLTLGLGNLVYAIIAHYTAEVVILKVDPTNQVIAS